MKLLRVVLLVAFVTPIVATAQVPQPDWTPQAVLALRQHATSRTQLPLDHSMLVLASKAEQDDDDLRGGVTRIIFRGRECTIPSC
jgi:hypothetical protein